MKTEGHLKTSWGTVLFSDPDTGSLRHGVAGAVPHNVVCVLDGASAALLRVAPDGSRAKIGLPAIPQGAIASSVTSDEPFAIFTVRPLGGMSPRRLALQAGGLFLCADRNHEVTLSRVVCGPWEQFEFWPTDIAPPEPLLADGWVRWGDAIELAGQAVNASAFNLIEIRRSGEDFSRAVNPAKAAEQSVSQWRPMPWQVYQGRRRAWCAGLERESVFEGLDGHLFHTIHGVCEQLFEGRGFTVDDADAWLSVLRHRVSWCSARGIAYRLLVVPEHHAVYPDKIPGGPILSGERPVMRLLHEADPALRSIIVYPLDAMRNGRAQHETCMPHDLHFSSFGAFLCYRELMRSLPDVAPDRVIDLSDMTLRSNLVAGDVAYALGAPGRKVDWFVPPERHNRHYKSGAGTPAQLDVFERDCDLPSLVIFRSSNTTLLLPFLSQHFSRIVAQSGERMFFDLTEDESPNVVITEIPERHLAGGNPRDSNNTPVARIPADWETNTLEQARGHKLPLPRGF